MDKIFLRTEMLLGKEAVEKLKNSRVAVFGIGGVGGYALEALVRAGVGEIDIICAYDGQIVFVEVKARRTNEYGAPSEAVNYFKQRKISQVASQFLSKYRKLNYPVRFDVVEVYMEDMSVNHIENAFDSFLRY